MSRNIDIRGLGNEETLARVARLAYGSGLTEKTSGGNGNIGIFDGRVVKFNTHWSERGGDATEAMRASCNALRMRLSDIATSLLAAREDADAAINAKLARALAKVRAALGMAPDGAAVATTGLLERKAVAKVLNTIQEATGFDVWEDLRRGDPASLSSRGVDTTFGHVLRGFSFASAVRDAVASVARPSDGLWGAKLSGEATEFLLGVIRRDIAARRAEGRRVPTQDEILGGIRDFTSPYLNVTIQAFNLDAVGLRHHRRTLDRMCFGSPYLSGAPAEQRADRADVAASFLGDMDPENRGYSMTEIMALVSEKIPEMRHLQPQGRLTGETVWRACFNEEPSEEVAASWGAPAYMTAFVARLNEIVAPFCKRYGTDSVSRAMDVYTVGAFTAPIAATGMAFTPMMHQAMKVPGFVPDVDRDYVAAPPFYVAADAETKTDAELKLQLELDVVRQYPLVNFRDGDREGAADFRPFNGNVAGAKAAVPGLIAQVDAFFRTGAEPGNGLPAGITRVQRNLLLLGLSQPAFAPFMALVGVGGEHVQARIDVRRDGDAIVMDYSTLPDNPIEARYSYRIEADGSNSRVGEFVGRVRP